MFSLSCRDGVVAGLPRLKTGCIPRPDICCWMKLLIEPSRYWTSNMPRRGRPYEFSAIEALHLVSLGRLVLWKRGNKVETRLADTVLGQD